MEEQSTGELIKIEKTELNFEHWSETETLSSRLRESIRQAELVVVPFEGFREYPGPVFPAGTEDLFQFLREKSNTVEIAIEDADYKEISVHFDVITLATITVREVALALGAAWVIEYVKARVGSHSAQTEVRANIIVDRRNGKKRNAMQISYQGPAEAFENAMKEAVAKLTKPKPTSTKATRKNDGKSE
jgi:hypothetical protein